MRIVIHDYSGHPFQMQLSRHLAAKGHEVTHIYSASFQTPKGLVSRTSNDSKTLEIIGLDLGEEFQKYSFVKRRSQEIKYGKLLANKVEQIRPDVVISSNSPIDAQSILFKTCSRLDMRFVFWVQDIYSLAISQVCREKIPLFGSMIGKYYVHEEKRLLRKSDKVVSITEDFLPLLRSWGVREKSITVIPNWAPIDEIQLVPKSNSWSMRNELDKKFCFLYSGTLGFKHNPKLLLSLAEEYKNDEDVLIIVISEGPAIDWLARECSRLGLHNLRLMPFQDYRLYSSVLATADVLVAILEPSAGIYSVPSKVLTYMCAGKPLLLSVPTENLASRMVRKINAGFVVTPDDERGFLASSRQLYVDANQRQSMGKSSLEYALSNFDIGKIAVQFENLMLTHA